MLRRPMAKKKRRGKADESHGELAWATAEVSGGTLAVAIEGDVSEAWGKRVRKIVDRLSRSPHWGSIKVGRGKLMVKGVTEGHESDLRHVLDGAVQQANADFAPEPPDDDHRDSETSRADAAMTDAFRSFAPKD